jgi:hypothetical protein
LARSASRNPPTNAAMSAARNTEGSAIVDLDVDIAGPVWSLPAGLLAPMLLSVPTGVAVISVGLRGVAVVIKAPGGWMHVSVTARLLGSAAKNRVSQFYSPEG